MKLRPGREFHVLKQEFIILNTQTASWQGPKGTELLLLPQKAIFIPEAAILVVGDLHLGKSTHFRKAGFALPVAGLQEDLKNLSELIERWEPQTVVFLGDLFHSDYNMEWEAFCACLHTCRSCTYILVEGNHDVLSLHHYAQVPITVCRDFRYNEFIFLHEPPDAPVEDAYVIAGHIHPGIRLSGKGGLSDKIPCFLMTAHIGLMPAFGKLTGLQVQYPSKQDRVFGVIDQAITDLSYRE
jgi:uncharacterized protein